MRTLDQFDIASIFAAVKKEITVDTPELALPCTAQLPETAQPGQLPSSLERSGRLR